MPDEILYDNNCWWPKKRVYMYGRHNEIERKTLQNGKVYCNKKW